MSCIFDALSAICWNGGGEAFEEAYNNRRCETTL